MPEELGHYEMHKELNELFVDKDFKVLYRDANSSTGNQIKEQEANAFAAALLMPEEFVRQKIEESLFDLSDEESVKKLARAFNVSISAMTYRISNIGIFD